MMARGLPAALVLASFMILWDPPLGGFSSDGFSASTPIQDKGPDPSVSRATQLIRRWRVIIGTTFEERRASAEEPIMDSIEIVISPGAVKAVQDRATEQQLKAADTVVGRFALAMVAAGDRLPDGSVGITEAAIDLALKKVCPAYPLC